jgi:hypothetical protein
MNKLLVTAMYIFCFSKLAFADSVPIQDQTTLPCENSSSVDCSKTIITNSRNPAAGQDDAGTNKARQLISVPPNPEAIPPNTNATPVPENALPH